MNVTDFGRGSDKESVSRDLIKRPIRSLDAREPSRQLVSSDLQFSVLVGHTEAVTGVCLGGSGKHHLATSSTDGTLKVWDINAKRLLDTFKENAAKALCVVLDGDGELLASGFSDSTIKVWSTGSKCILHSLCGHTAPVTTMVFNPLTRVLIAGSEDNTLSLWNVESGALFGRFDGKSPVRSAALDRLGRFIASAHADNTVKIWNAVDMRLHQQFEVEKVFRRVPSWSHEENIAIVTNIAFHPSEKIVAVSHGTHVSLWNFEVGRLMCELDGGVDADDPDQEEKQAAHTNRIGPIAFHPDGRSIAGCSNNGTLVIWEPPNENSVRTIRVGYHGRSGSSIAFDRSGVIVVVGCSDGSFSTFEFATGDEKWRQDSNADTRALAFYPHNDVLLASYPRLGSAAWDLKSGQFLRFIRTDGNIVALDPTGRFLGIGGECFTVLESSNLRYLWSKSIYREVKSASFDRTGTVVAYPNDTFRFQVRDAFTGLLVNKDCYSQGFHDSDFSATNVGFSPTADLLICSSIEGRVEFWDSVKIKRIAVVETEFRWPGSLLFHPRGNLFAFTSGRSILVWNVETRSVFRRLDPVGEDVGKCCGIAFDNEGEILASIYSSGRAILWSVSSWKPTSQFSVPKNSSSIALHTSLPMMAVGYSNGATNLHRIPDGELLVILLLVSSEDWISYTQAGYYIGSPRVTEQVNMRFMRLGRSFPSDVFPRENPNPPKIRAALSNFVTVSKPATEVVVPPRRDGEQRRLELPERLAELDPETP